MNLRRNFYCFEISLLQSWNFPLFCFVLFFFCFFFRKIKKQKGFLTNMQVKIMAMVSYNLFLLVVHCFFFFLCMRFLLFRQLASMRDCFLVCICVETDSHVRRCWFGSFDFNLEISISEKMCETQKKKK
jgi:hypothetical protein